MPRPGNGDGNRLKEETTKAKQEDSQKPWLWGAGSASEKERDQGSFERKKFRKKGVVTVSSALLGVRVPVVQRL